MFNKHGFETKIKSLSNNETNNKFQFKAIRFKWVMSSFENFNNP